MTMDIKNAFKKRFTLRRPVKGAKYASVGVPWMIIEREAEKHNMDVDAFLETYEVECLFDNFEGFHYQIVVKE